MFGELKSSGPSLCNEPSLLSRGIEPAELFGASACCSDKAFNTSTTSSDTVTCGKKYVLFFLQVFLS